MPTKSKKTKTNKAAKTSAARKAYQAKWIAAKRAKAKAAKAAPAPVVLVVLVTPPPPPPVRQAILQADGVYRLGDCPKCVAAGGTCSPCRMEMADGATPDPLPETGDASDYAYGV